MTRPCSRVMDEPLRVLGADDEEWAVGVIVFTMLPLLGSSLGGLLGAGLAMGVLRSAKRGQPSGVVVHRFWTLGMRMGPWPSAPTLQGSRYSPW